MDNREWAEFANNLAGVLHRCPKDSVLILNAGDRFIDFTPGTGAGRNYLCVQVCDNITDAGRRFLRDNGWWAPADSGDLNWMCEYRNPSTAEYHGVAEAAVEVLREVFAVASPTQIHPEGWLDGRGDFKLPIDQVRSTVVSEISDELRPLVPIAAALSTNAPWLVPTVAYILADPEHDRGFGPWQRFLDALGDPYSGGLGLLAQFHWKQDADQVRDVLRCLPSHPAALSWDWFPDFAANTAGWHPGDIIEGLLDRVAADCHHLGLALVSFDTDGDVFATFVPVDDVDELREVTAAAGHRLSVWRAFGRPNSRTD